MINVTAEWVPTQEEFNAFADVSGDDNAIHVDPEFSARTTFGRTVSHGMLIYSKLWGLIRNARPDVRQVSQKMMFPNPTFVGDRVVLSVRETEPNKLTIKAMRPADSAELLVGETEIA